MDSNNNAAGSSNKVVMPVVIHTTNEWLMSVQRVETTINDAQAEDEIVFFVFCPECGGIIDTPVSVSLSEAKRLSVILDKMTANVEICKQQSNTY